MKETMYPCVRPTRRCFEGNDRLTGFFGALLKRCTRLQGPLTCIPWWRAKSGTDKRSEKRERREGSWEASSLSVRHILPRAKRMSPFPERLSRSRYLHLGFHASISETREQIGREKEKEGESRLTGSSHAIRCILPTSYNSFFALLLVSRYTRSTASRTFRGRSSHYACPIHSMLANGTKALQIASVFPYRRSECAPIRTYANF